MASYELIGSGPRDAADDVKRHYREAVLRHHPDRGGDHEQFLEVQTAIDHIVARRKSVANALGRPAPSKGCRYDRCEHGDRMHLESRRSGAGSGDQLSFNDSEACECALEAGRCDAFESIEQRVDVLSEMEPHATVHHHSKTIEDTLAIDWRSDGNSAQEDAIDCEGTSVVCAASREKRRSNFDFDASHVGASELQHPSTPVSPRELNCVSEPASGSRRHTAGSLQCGNRTDDMHFQPRRRHTFENEGSSARVRQISSSVVGEAWYGQLIQSRGLQVAEAGTAQGNMPPGPLYAQSAAPSFDQTRPADSKRDEHRARRATIDGTERVVENELDVSRRQRNTLACVQEEEKLRWRTHGAGESNSGDCPQGSQNSEVSQGYHEEERVQRPSVQDAETHGTLPTLLQQTEPCTGKERAFVKSSSSLVDPEGANASRLRVSVDELPPSGCTVRAAAAIPSLRQPSFEPGELVRLVPDLRGAAPRGSCPNIRFSA
eukprot:TRINITY_DN14995_c0_g2_i2.p2 TRINITY_DN14995_c0_g2~~TRINITY_DN14995_c0_g2_i2.p2  ORF type:complete len:490 (-),score=49.28 TRINITY_DN14995_c0_g2_i2:302-1771(-)